eukprot:gene30202-5054_t
MHPRVAAQGQLRKICHVLPRPGRTATRGSAAVRHSPPPLPHPPTAVDAMGEPARAVLLKPEVNNFGREMRDVHNQASSALDRVFADSRRGIWVGARRQMMEKHIDRYQAILLGISSRIAQHVARCNDVARLARKLNNRMAAEARASFNIAAATFHEAAKEAMIEGDFILGN